MFMYIRMYVCMYEHIHVCACVELCIYEFVFVSTFNQKQILSKLDTMLRHCRTHKGKIYGSKKNGWRTKFCGGSDQNNLQPVVSSGTDNRSRQSSDIWRFSFLNYVFSNGQVTDLNHFSSKLLGLGRHANYNGRIISPKEWTVRSEHVGHCGV